MLMSSYDMLLFVFRPAIARLVEGSCERISFGRLLPLGLWPFQGSTLLACDTGSAPALLDPEGGHLYVGSLTLKPPHELLYISTCRPAKLDSYHQYSHDHSFACISISYHFPYDMHFDVRICVCFHFPFHVHLLSPFHVYVSFRFEVDFHVHVRSLFCFHVHDHIHCHYHYCDHFVILLLLIMTVTIIMRIMFIPQ